MSNKEWSENILNSLDPSFKHKWEIYENHLRKHLNHNTIWLDLGCGNNADIEEKKDLVLYAAGVDIVRNDNLLSQPFIIADITSLPFKTGSIGVISLRFVIEHIADPKSLFNEIHRVLCTNGTVILVTTNILSHIIFIPKMLPYSLRKFIIKKLFKAYDEDIFPTHHKFNSYFKITYSIKYFRLAKFEFIQDLNFTRRIIFVIFLLWHLFTKIMFLKIFRTNIMAVYKKEI